jgi:gamma-glutamyl-gamma-aminobutyrate hydrolase PuuD
MRTPSRPSPGRPRIGIPVRLSSSSDPDPRVGEANESFDYIVALVRDGGGEPVPLAEPLEGLEGLDGVVLPGGGDLDPRLYGEEPGPACHDVNIAQDALAAEDGTVEALEDPGRWVASVQWHPEAPELSAEERIAPFRAFEEVCRSAAGLPG